MKTAVLLGLFLGFAVPTYQLEHARSAGARTTQEMRCGVAELYSPDAVYLTQHFVGGVVEGRAAIQVYVQRGVDAMYHVDDIAVLRTDCSQDMAYVIDRYTSTNAGQKSVGVNLVVLRKISWQWRIVAHEAAVPDPATAVQSLDMLEH